MRWHQVASWNAACTENCALANFLGGSLMKRSFLMMVAVLIPVMLFAQAASKLAPELQHAAGNQAVAVIVQYKSVPPQIQQSIIWLRNGMVTSQLPVINSLQAVVPGGSLAALSADSRVAYVSPDRPVR